MITIVIEDMHIRDERVLEWIRAQSHGAPIQISAQAIADKFGCHYKTAQAILKRLVRAGHIEIVSWRRTGGYHYRIAS